MYGRFCQIYGMVLQKSFWHILWNISLLGMHFHFFKNISNTLILFSEHTLLSPTPTVSRLHATMH